MHGHSSHMSHDNVLHFLVVKVIVVHQKILSLFTCTCHSKVTYMTFFFFSQFVVCTDKNSSSKYILSKAEGSLK